MYTFIRLTGHLDFLQVFTRHAGHLTDQIDLEKFLKWMH